MLRHLLRVAVVRPRTARALASNPPGSGFLASLKKNIDAGMKEAELERDIAESRRRVRESRAAAVAGKAAEVAGEAAGVVGKAAQAGAGVVAKGARVTGRATAEIADRTGVSAAATATASAARRAVGPDSAIGKTAAAVGETRAAQAVAASAQVLLENTPYEGSVVSRRSVSDVGRRQRVRMNEDVTALAGTGTETFSSRVGSLLTGLSRRTGLDKKLSAVSARIAESEGPGGQALRGVVGVARDVAETASGAASAVSAFMMPETENGRAIAQIRAMDPAFEPYEFVRWCRDDLIPRVLKAQMAENREALGNACSKKVMSVLEAHWAGLEAAGARDASTFFDIRNVEFVSAQLKDEGVPVVLIMFRSSGVDHIVSKKTGETITGDPGRVLHKTSVWAVTVDQEDEDWVQWKVDEFTTHGVEGLI